MYHVSLRSLLYFFEKQTIFHPGYEILDWQRSNVVIEIVQEKYYRLSKQHRDLKIDSMMALVFSVYALSMIDLNYLPIFQKDETA